MTFEETVIFCKHWFKENKVEIPKTAQEWTRGRSGETVPPRCTYGSLRRRGIRVGSLLEELIPRYNNRIKNIDNDYSWLENIGLTFVKRGEGELIEYKCNKCNSNLETRKGTLRRWEAAKSAYCSICRGSSGKSKPHDYYQQFLPEEFSTVCIEGRVLKIRHNTCNTVFTRSVGYIGGTQRTSENLCCPTCYKGFVSGKSGEYSSLIEKEITEHLISVFPDLEFQREKLYGDLISTDRMYRADIWLPKLNAVLEITSRGNNLPNYQNNLNTKLELLHKNNIKAFCVTSKSELEDIVRSLLKNKE